MTRLYLNWFLQGSLMIMGAWACLLSRAGAEAYSSDDANTLMDAYNRAFLKSSGESAYFSDTQSEGTTYFWSQAEEIEGEIDAYERTWNPSYQSNFERLLRGFVKTNQRSWGKNEYNDDCMWACIAFSRAYLDTGDEWFLSVAKSNFDMVYTRAWDDTLGGGMWWRTDNKTKNACVNGPGAIAAYLLYMSTGDKGYLDKANALYDWERGHLFNSDTGQVYDSIDLHGKIATFATTYNQGTFVGAAFFLGHNDDAARATDYMMKSMGGAPGASGIRIMPSYGINGNNSGFNGIAIRWIAKFMINESRQGSYLPWLQANAQAAWDLRRTSDNLSWCQWEMPTPPDAKFHSWDCISSVVALQDIPAPSAADTGSSHSP